MSLEDIERDFPSLKRGENYDEASELNFNYNCLAFVLGDYYNWWEPPALFGHYWPPGFPEDVKVETVTAIIKLHGFTAELERNTLPGRGSLHRIHQLLVPGDASRLERRAELGITCAAPEMPGNRGSAHRERSELCLSSRYSTMRLILCSFAPTP